MSDFIEKSKDMVDDKNLDECKRKRIKDVLDEIDKMYKIAHFYSMDVDNIEDVLSILEMNEHIGIGKPGFKEIYTDYIKDVIEYYTPPLLKPEKPVFNDKLLDDQYWQHWYSHLFGYMPNTPSRCQELKTGLGFLVASIHNLRFQKEQPESEIQFNRISDFQTHYSIITLNYDRLLENVCDFISYYYGTNGSVNFATDTCNTESPILAKLHGSIGVNATIIPPTWNKSITTESKIQNTWKLAYKALVEANYIRIIGYSFPATDTYVKYLLSSAVMKAFHLKKIDIICEDLDGAVEQKYDNFINFRYKRFKNRDVRDYLRGNYSACCNFGTDGIGSKEIKMNGLEEAHEAFFGGK